MAVIVDIAKDLMAALAAAALMPDPTVKRLYRANWDKAVEYMKGPTLFVVTNGSDVEDGTRAFDKFTYTLQVGVFVNVTSDEGAPVDDMIDFTEKVLDVIRANKEVANATLKKASGGGTYNADLMEKRVFASVIQCDYEMLR